VTATLSNTLKLLSDPTRLRLLVLLGAEELAVQELVAVTGLAQSRVSNHLSLLRRAGLVRDRRDGSWSFYSLVEPTTDGPLTPELRTAVLAPFAESEEGRRDRTALDAVREQRRQRSREAHDALAERWVEVGQEFGSGAVRAEVVASALPETMVVADLGCGAGYLTAYLTERVSRVVAVDHSPNMLDAAQRRGLDPARVEFRRGELDALPLADSEVDAAFSSLVWHHLPDLEAAAREVYRVVRPGGAVVVCDLLPHQEEWMREHMGDLRLGTQPDQVVTALARAGFENLHVGASADCYRVERPGESGPIDLPLFVVRGRRPRGDGATNGLFSL